MFEIGDYIVCGNNGICKVENIGTIDIPDVDPDRLYYILQPVMTKASVVYIPTDNEKIVMRKMITAKEAEALMEAIPEVELIDAVNDKQREECFKECLRQHDCGEWIRMIKTLYVRRKERLERGQKVTATDARYLKLAEDNLYGELSLALGKEKEEVEDFLSKRLDNCIAVAS